MQPRLPITIECKSPEPARVPPARPRHGDDWRIDDRTRRVGLRGVERARAALDATVADGQSRQADAA
jgi:hypothetical protein